MTKETDASELRATILGETLRQVALVPGPSTPGAVLRGVMERLGRNEEAIGGDIHVALAMLVRSDLVGCNTADDSNVYFTAETMLTPSKGLTAFVWDDDFAASVS